MTAPPDFAIRAAVEAGRRSPCAKSKRGAAVFRRACSTGCCERVLGVGWNAQPVPFSCTGSSACKAACGKLCLHAEARAIRAAWREWTGGVELVHAKVVNGLLVPGGGPSCWQCSREVLDVGLAAVWLYEGPDGRRPEHYRCTACSEIMTQYHEFEEYQHAGCLGLVERVGEWRRYTAEEFHRATLAACGIEVPR